MVSVALFGAAAAGTAPSSPLAPESAAIFKASRRDAALIMLVIASAPFATA
jgi:hypothetical protein